MTPDFFYVPKLLLKKKTSDPETIGVMDYFYLPLALGDAITSIVNLSMQAHETGTKKTRIFVVADGRRVNHQYHITRVNYYQHVNDLLPVYYCTPNLASLHVMYDRDNLDSVLLTSHLKGHALWPSYHNNLKRKVDYYSHIGINAFFRKHGFIPKIVAPLGYEKSTDQLFNNYLKGKFVVAVNIRQRQFQVDHAQLERDSSISEWYKFFRIAQEKFPNVTFVNMGGFAEWDRELINYPNVVIPRTLGFGLGEELSVLLKANLFMGTSSGFAAGATFSDVPYVITNYEHAVASRVELNIGESYPFANKYQTISWERETADLLLALFVEKYRALS
ncbi:MAG: hypothetical protein A4S09_02520 [Proteobacteria bacterium SG_bin7]|nr:MAG: hypothetical protein A4S09_02520 [Proteobacteria bacterium SG_bin7]